MKYPEGTSYVMEVRNGPDRKSGIHTYGTWEEEIPDKLGNEDMRHLPPEERAKACVQFWNETLRSHDCTRELVKVFRVEMAKTEIEIP